jgi:hypothetical protein
MRKINTNDFRVATRTTSREINRRIALNLVREHQPISRADLAGKMNVTRSVVSVLIAELMAEEIDPEEGYWGGHPRPEADISSFEHTGPARIGSGYQVEPDLPDVKRLRGTADFARDIWHDSVAGLSRQGSG